MKIELKINRDQLNAINTIMAPLDVINFQSLPRSGKSNLAACVELRHKFLQKSIKQQHNHKPFKISIPYYLAEHLLHYLSNFKGNLSPFDANAGLIIINQLHQKLL
ncbi:hypothetical protein OK18_19200 [Chryseobacterium gallinarum]|uniref:Uncharacterized protein n=1 Tax=Chryseobacterium gallinarum TaxID=1324352 RepID=A0A0G3M6C4_CHRGL|nr:hypothetical protein [Chryseobacterium gallinarum]AKK74459.1 hypothetical protein OK18_19200 [Chryseobacterium gallinarum]